MSRRFPAQVEIILAALLFSTGGAAIKAATFSSWQVAGFRSALAAVALLIALPGARRKWTAAGLLVSLAYSATMILFVAANKLTTSMNTIFLQGTAPLYVLGLSPVLLRERIQKRDLLVMVVIVVGLAMFFLGAERPQFTAPHPALGNGLAVLSAVTWALTIMGFRWLGSRSRSTDASLSAAVMGNLLTCAICLPFALPVPTATNTLHNWLVMLFLGVFQIGLAYVFLVGGLARSPAFSASILLLAEPVFNPIWTFFLHGEVPGGLAIVGGLLILTATIVRSCTPVSSPASENRTSANTR